MTQERSGGRMRGIADFISSVRAVDIDNGRAFANAVAQANERYGVPLDMIAGFNGHSAMRWKQGRSLPDRAARRAALARICVALEMHTTTLAEAPHREH